MKIYLNKIKLDIETVKKFFLLVFFTLISASLLLSQNDISYKIKTVVIDAGHGGHDPGAVGKFSKEKDLTLAIVLKLGKLIQDNFKEIKVIYTRSEDKFVELYKRAEIANKNKADLFISIHINAGSSVASGTETFVMGNDKTGANLQVTKLENSVVLKEDNYLDKYEGFDPNDPETHIILSLYQNANLSQSLFLAQAFQDKFTSKLKRNNRGVKQAGFLVLWKTAMPSILTELGFISNSEEEKYLNTEEGKNNFAKAMFEAFVKFKNNYEDTNIQIPIDYHAVDNSNLANNTSLKKDSVDIIKNNQTMVLDSNKQENNNLVVENIKKENKDTSDTKLNTTNNQILFKIQVKTSSKALKINKDNFKHYTNVEYYQHDGVYKYTIGSETSYDKILIIYEQVKKDFKDCFIIALKNGDRIPLNKAKSELNNGKK